MVRFVKQQLEDYKQILRSIPALFVTLYVVSVILMNLMANKEVYTGLSWLVLDCGFTVSWMSFLTMDTITKRFGPRVSTKLSILAVGVNLLCCLIMFGVSKIPGNWSQFYNFDSPNINDALNNTIGGSWYVVLGSTIAFLTSAVVNNFLNSFIGSRLKSNSFAAFAVRSWISTGIGQFVDNFVFAFIVSHVFFGWTMLQCVVCAITGALIELLCEVIFSPVGYKICKQWEVENVGQSYIDSHKRGAQ